MNNEVPISYTDKDYTLWEDFLYEKIVNEWLPTYITERTNKINWFYRGIIHLQSEITIERPDFKLYYETYYKVFDRLIKEGLNYDMLFVLSFAS